MGSFCWIKVVLFGQRDLELMNRTRKLRGTRMWNVKCGLLVMAMICLFFLPVGAKAKTEMDVEAILEKVRKAQRPCENMRIEWISERASMQGITVGSRPAADSQDEPEDSQQELRQIWSATVSGIRSRLKDRQEAFRKPTSRVPDGIKEKTRVFNGTRFLLLETTTYLRKPGYLRKHGFIMLNNNNLYLLRQELFSSHDRPPIWDKEGLKNYRLTLRKGSRSGILILDATSLDSKWLKWIWRLTIDTDRGYNVIKKETIRADGSKDLEYNFEVKQWANGRWFISGREKVRFNRDGKPRHIEEKFEVTSVQFDVPEPPDETFKLSFPEGTKVHEFAFDYEMNVLMLGSLNGPKYTKEQPKVSAILDDDRLANNSPGSFGPVRERIINRTDHRKDCFIDLDSGRTLSVPADFHFNTKDRKFWLEDNSIDGRAETDNGLCGLWTFHTIVVPVSSDRWKSITPTACNEALERVDGIQPPIMSAEGQLPATFLFQTWDNRGILQILEVQRNKEPHFIKVRYKIIKDSQDVER